MASAAVQTRPSNVPAKFSNDFKPQRSIRTLVVSPEREVRQRLLRALEALPADVVACSNRAQAEEVLSKQTFEVVFCDEHLPDGSYYELIHPTPGDRKVPKVVVATRNGEWDLYFAALGKGAFDVIRCPWYATDVEMTVIRALREEDQAVSSHDVI